VLRPDDCSVHRSKPVLLGSWAVTSAVVTILFAATLSRPGTRSLDLVAAGVASLLISGPFLLAARVKLVVCHDGITVHNLLSNHRIRWHEIQRFSRPPEPAPSTPSVLWRLVISDPSIWLRFARVDLTDGTHVPIHATRSDLVVARLNEALGTRLGNQPRP